MNMKTDILDSQVYLHVIFEMWSYCPTGARCPIDGLLDLKCNQSNSIYVICYFNDSMKQKKLSGFTKSKVFFRIRTVNSQKLERALPPSKNCQVAII